MLTEPICERPEFLCNTPLSPPRPSHQVDDSDVLKLKEQQDIGGHLKGNPSLALIRKQAKREENERRAEDDSNNQMSKRVKIANFASEDSMLRATKLYTYFCKFCGDWCLITDAGKLNRLTQRRSDGSIVIQETVFTARLNVNGAKRKTIIRRENGKCEEQYRFQCKGCGNLVGYRCNPLGELSPACYIFQDTLCEEQSAAMKFQ